MYLVEKANIALLDGITIIIHMHGMRYVLALISFPGLKIAIFLIYLL